MAPMSGRTSDRRRWAPTDPAECHRPMIDTLVQVSNSEPDIIAPWAPSWLDGILLRGVKPLKVSILQLAFKNTQMIE